MTDNQPHHHRKHTPAPAPPVDLVACTESLVKTVIRGMSDEVAPHGLNAVEFSLLKSCMARGECTATDLAGILPVDASRISRLVTSLVGKDLLVRRRLPEDRRVVMLSLSDKGEELVSVLTSNVQTRNAALAEGIADQDLSTFESVTRRILANHEATDSSG